VISRPLALILAGGLVAGGAAWAARTDSPAASSSPTVDAPSGAALFRAKGCAVCHDGPDSASLTDFGPSLANAPSWAGSRVDGLSAEDYVAQSILDPGAVTSPAAAGQGEMPPIAMGPGEVDALVAYLLTAAG
jgi:hypothetical protein